jgi:ABC-2 type transport system ATP-binding protein
MLVLREGRIIEQVAIKAVTQTQDFKLTLATPVENLVSILQQIDKLKIIKVEHEQSVLLQIPSDSQQQHEVLKTLLAQNLPVCEFAKITSNLQDAYLETMRQRP